MRTLKTSLFLFLFALITQLAQASGGELLLFHNGSDHPVTKDFLEKYAPQIEEMAISQDITVKRVDVTKGAPELVRHTPAIVFQNHLGRSLYIGRYHYVDKIKTFLRTVKRLPQKDVVNEKHDVMVWDYELGRVLTPVKVTELAGDLPEGFDQEAFLEKAMKAIAKGTQNYRFEKHYDARRTDRLMYSAFYPYLSNDGKVFISMEAYSQFNCVIPIFKQFDEPVSGDFKSWEKAFEEAGAMVEQQIIAQLESTKLGDGFLPVKKGTPTKSFDALGFPLPAAPKGASGNLQAVDLVMPQKWVIDGPIEDDVPLINFSFPAPLEYYAGEIKEMEGGMELGPGAAIGNSMAAFSAVLESMTMGDESLDHSVADMIALMDYPKSSFTFKQIDVVDQPNLSFGSMTQVKVNGSLDFKGIKAPVTVSSQIEPILNEAGQPRLQVYAFFKMPLKDKWDIDGPDGPEASSNFLDFNLNFLLKPSQSSRPGSGSVIPPKPGNGTPNPPNPSNATSPSERGDAHSNLERTQLMGGDGLKTIEVNGLTYSYFEKGQGKTVFLLHGFPDLASTWGDAMNELSKDYHCIAPFLRGYYPSDTATDGDYSSMTIAKDIAGIATELGIEKYSVIGHDWGASIAYSLANLYPDRVEKLVAVAIPHPSYIKLTPRLAIRARHFIKFRKPKSSVESTRKNDFAYIDKLFKRWAPNWAEWEATSKEVKETFRKPGRLEAALGYYWSLSNAPKDPERDELSNRLPAVPFLVFAGKADGALVMKPFRKMEKELGDKVKVVVDDKAGHFFHREAPELFLKEVKAYLGS